METQKLLPSQAALWHLGQAGVLSRCGGVTLVIDPYLSDSVARIAPESARLHPVPVPPQELKEDLFLVTHDHMDHLDPETIGEYRFKSETLFVAPRLACRKLKELGIPEKNIIRLDRGEERSVRDVLIRATFAVPTDSSVEDTVGFFVQFPNGRSLYHSGDTGFSEKLLQSAPHAEILEVCINGKWGNLNVQEAVRLTQAVRPRIAIPNHYDLMGNNLENPENFESLARREAPECAVRILRIMEPFVW
jgi:L-ascorbate 6-phosphate lactonase